MAAKIFVQLCFRAIRNAYNPYAFSWDRRKSFEGDTGSYLQYTHYLHARDITSLLGTYPDSVKVALKTHEPSGVVTFAFRLAHAISDACDSVIVKGEDDLGKAWAKMFLYERVREVLSASVRLLSIKLLERM
ncbi:hypothetical protein BDN70DRAFT_924775 [Pholiota conissans]|uniref:arginine--tRNA ligase n=1 Tax=Pholiota conissans TaxID=109636 RepID=A0A9P6CVG5_9AGAR|nr:hypothetical protein BDN70DRAFT_924775 [Pholiota conissans]